MMYRKLKRVWSHSQMNHIPEFMEAFPELKNVSREEMCDRWRNLGITFYGESEVKKVPLWIRLTSPFALILLILMLFFMPIKFIIIGSAKYDFDKSPRIYNWLNSLNLIF